MSPTVKQRKIALLGSRSVGKSAMTVRYIEGHFVDSYYPTIENTFSKEIVHKGQTFLTEIIDTQGQDEYSILNSKHFIGIHGYMLVYSVSSVQSFEMIKVIHDKILNHLGADFIPIIIVGNKSDKTGDARKVSKAEGQALAKEMGAAFAETSARDDRNIAQAFELMISEIEKGNEPDKPAGGSKCLVM